MVFLAMLTEIYDHILDLVGSMMAGSEPWAHWGHAGSFITDLQVAHYLWVRFAKSLGCVFVTQLMVRWVEGGGISWAGLATQVLWAGGRGGGQGRAELGGAYLSPRWELSWARKSQTGWAGWKLDGVRLGMLIILQCKICAWGREPFSCNWATHCWLKENHLLTNVSEQKSWSRD